MRRTRSTCATWDPCDPVELRATRRRCVATRGRAMDAAEVKAFGELGGRALASPAETVRDVHGAMAGRVFGMLGPIGAPVRVMHDGISRAAYASVSTALRVPLQAGGRVIGSRRLPGGRSMADTPAGAFALGALNGMWGDTIAESHPELAIELSIRRGGRVRGADVAAPQAGPDRRDRLGRPGRGLRRGGHRQARRVRPRPVRERGRVARRLRPS